MTRPGRLGLGALLLLNGCFKDRPRPDPLESGGNGVVTVEVLRPADNATVIAGRTMLIDVKASSAGPAISGLGYLVRVVEGGQRLDSLVQSRPPRVLSRDSFQVVVPGQLATNTHLSVNALALTTRGTLRYSPATQVVIAQCNPDIPTCR